MKAIFQNPSRAVFLVALFALIIAILFQIGLPAQFRGRPGGEWEQIWQPATRSFMAGDGFLVDDGEPLTAFPPGFPMFLAGAFIIGDALGASTTTAALVMNIIAYVFVVVFVYLTSYLLWKRWEAALVSAVLTATYPFILWVLRIPSTEPPYMAVFYAAWWVLWRSILKDSRSLVPYFLCGVLIGVSMLIRPAGILTGLLAAVTILMALWKSQRSRSLVLAATLLVGNFLILLPWEISLFNNTQRIILLGTVGDRNIIGGLSFSYGDTEDERTIPVSESILAFQNHLDERADDINGYGSYVSVMLDEFIKDPVTVTFYFLIKAARSWYGSDTGNMDVISLFVQIPYLTLIVVAGFFTFRRGGTTRIYVISTLLLLIYFWILAITSFPLLRYLAPMFGTLFVFVPALILRIGTFGFWRNRQVSANGT